MGPLGELHKFFTGLVSHISALREESAVTGVETVARTVAARHATTLGRSFQPQEGLKALTASQGVEVMHELVEIYRTKARPLLWSLQASAAAPSGLLEGDETEPRQRRSLFTREELELCAPQVQERQFGASSSSASQDQPRGGAAQDCEAEIPTRTRQHRPVNPPVYPVDCNRVPRSGGDPNDAANHCDMLSDRLAGFEDNQEFDAELAPESSQPEVLTGHSRSNDIFETDVDEPTAQGMDAASSSGSPALAARTVMLGALQSGLGSPAHQDPKRDSPEKLPSGGWTEDAALVALRAFYIPLHLNLLGARRVEETVCSALSSVLGPNIVPPGGFGASRAAHSAVVKAEELSATTAGAAVGFCAALAPALRRDKGKENVRRNPKLDGKKDPS